MVKICRQCSQQFEITDEDLKFYEKVSPEFNGKKNLIPPPALCPDCRVQRRMSFRNFRNLYQYKCDLTGKQIISMYAPGNLLKVYDIDAWWSDRWDPMEYGKPVDFNQSFFKQIKELMAFVPKFAVYNALAENCQYSNSVLSSKNCYLVFGCVRNEDCCYGHIVWESKNCFDSLYILGCEFCYECTDCIKCYNLKWSQDCENCFDSYFLKDCKGCNNCFCCAGLKNKSYCIQNEQYSKEDYNKKIQELALTSILVNQMKEKMNLLNLQGPHSFIHSINIENCSGDYIYFSKNVSNSFDTKRSEDCKFLYTAIDFKDSYDVNYSAAATELAYDSVHITGYKVQFSHITVQSENVLYCEDCFYCKYCFGCIGLKNKSFCVLNKQYLKEEYFELVPKIIEHMRKTGEWGEFFSYSLSHFGYNETIANEYFPLSKEEAIAKGFNWSDYESPAPQVEKILKASELPDISVIPASSVIPAQAGIYSDDILNYAIECEITKKPFKIIKQELEFYKKNGITLPRRHPDQRHKDRMALRNPRKLWERDCMKCEKEIKTTYAPERPEIVCCEECYLKEVY
jgi:hypothetical protein